MIINPLHLLRKKNSLFLKNNLSFGRKPENVDEIVLSSSMMKKLNNGKINESKDLQLSFVVSESGNGGEIVKKNFKTVDLKVVGIVEEERNLIYQNSDWLITFFQSRLGVSAYYLGINVIAMDTVNEKGINDTLRLLSRAFPEYSIVNPLSEINASIDRICSYIQIALLAFSTVAILISIMILTISNYLHVVESRKEIGLARCLGVNKKEAKKFLYSHSFLLCLISLFLSIVELVVLSFVISYIISNEMGSSFIYSFDIKAVFLMMIIAITVSLFSSLLMGKSINKIEPLEAIKA